MPELSSTRRTDFLSFQPPAITEEEVEAVAETLRSGWLTTGPRTAELEARMRDYLEAKHVLAVSSCTAALHLSLVALGIGPGDEVIVPDVTWIATSAPVSYVGATVVFADFDPVSWCITADSIEAVLTPRTKAVIVVDLYGNMPDFDPILELCRERIRGDRGRGRSGGSDLQAPSGGLFR